MTDRERDLLIAEATSAWRPRMPDGRLLPHPAWADLDSAARLEAFEESLALRVLEAALDRDGYSTTVRAVAEAIAGR
jgi:hypothetical protein